MYSNRGPDGKPFARVRGGLGRSTRHEKDTTTPRPPSIPTKSRAYLAHISGSSSLREAHFLDYIPSATASAPAAARPQPLHAGISRRLGSRVRTRSGPSL